MEFMAKEVNKTEKSLPAGLSANTVMEKLDPSTTV